MQTFIIGFIAGAAFIMAVTWGIIEHIKKEIKE